MNDICIPKDCVSYSFHAINGVGTTLIAVNKGGELEKLNVNEILDNRSDFPSVVIVSAVIRECIKVAESHSKEVADAIRAINIDVDNDAISAQPI